jgi:hypothetical protein
MTDHEPDHDLPAPGESLASFLSRTDPACHAWMDRVEWSPDIGLAIALGELQTVCQLMEIARTYEGSSLERALGIFLAQRGALRRIRDAKNFSRALARHRATNNEHEGGPDGSSR